MEVTHQNQLNGHRDFDFFLHLRINKFFHDNQDDDASNCDDDGRYICCMNSREDIDVNLQAKTEIHNTDRKNEKIKERRISTKLCFLELVMRKTKQNKNKKRKLATKEVIIQLML